jgi:hypothetical protein
MIDDLDKAVSYSMYLNFFAFRGTFPFTLEQAYVPTDGDQYVLRLDGPDLSGPWGQDNYDVYVDVNILAQVQKIPGSAYKYDEAITRMRSGFKTCIDIRDTTNTSLFTVNLQGTVDVMRQPHLPQQSDMLMFATLSATYKGVI